MFSGNLEQCADPLLGSHDGETNQYRLQHLMSRAAVSSPTPLPPSNWLDLYVYLTYNLRRHDWEEKRRKRPSAFFS